MIELKNITFSYGRKATPALDDVSASIGSGLYLLAGENGAGKTTLLHVMAGLAHPSKGECVINGVASTSVNPEELGHVFLLEERMYFPGRNIREFAALHSQFYSSFTEEVFEQNLKEFGLTGNELFSSMSLGNLKKSQLAYVLALGVDVLMLDEPTNALDIEGRIALRKLIATTMRPEQTVIVATHNVTDLETLFDGALMMRASRIEFAGTEELVSSRIAFEMSASPDPEALYSENQMGRYMNLYPALEPGETRVDWRALYSALHSDRSYEIISQLSK